MTRQIVTLAQRAKRANEHHAKFREAVHSALVHARNAGVELQKAKKQVGHGGWTAWLEKHFHASEETARVYMRIATSWDRLKQHYSFNDSTSIQQALTYLKAKREPGDRPPPPILSQAQLAAKIAAQVKKCLLNWSHDELYFFGALNSNDTLGIGFPTFLDTLRNHVKRIAPIVAEAEKKRVAAYYRVVKQYKGDPEDGERAQRIQKAMEPVNEAFAKEIRDKLGKLKDLTKYEAKVMACFALRQDPPEEMAQLVKEWESDPHGYTADI